jgi:flagellar basal body rod protein FlgG
MLTLSFNSSVSGIRAAIDMRDLSANNTANINTDGYKKQRVNLSEGTTNGVFVNMSGSTETGLLYKNEKGDTFETSNVNYPEEIANQISATHLLLANIAVINRTDEVYEGILDIIA